MKGKSWPIAENQARAVREGMGKVPGDDIRRPLVTAEDSSARAKATVKCVGVDSGEMFEWIYREGE